jgi:hypothetical protein
MLFEKQENIKTSAINNLPACITAGQQIRKWP